MRLVTLTPEQDKRYGQLSEIAMSSGIAGITDLSADEQAWQGICEEWPRTPQP